MDAALLLLLQATAGSTPAPIDLTQPLAGVACPAASSDDIVVCGTRPRDYRLAKPDPRYEGDRPRRAEVGVLGGRAGVEVEAVPMPGGVQSNRLMVRLRLPF